jgi:hypothetical protein
VLGSTGGPSSLATSISAAAELLEDQVDAAATNKLHWGSHFVLVAAMSHFPKLDANLEVLESGCSAGLVEGKVDALWSRVCAALDSLVSHVPPLVARNPPDSIG